MYCYLGSHPATTLEEVLESFSLPAIEACLKSIYRGRLERPVFYRDSLQLYRITHTLQIGWLFDETTEHIKESVACVTVLETLVVALDHSDQVLTRACEDIFSRNYLGDIVSPAEPAWWEQSRDIAQHVLCLPALRLETELDVFVHVLYWIERNISVSNRDECVDVLQCVRVFAVPHVFRESFLYPYISIISQKFFLALKYPQVSFSPSQFPWFPNLTL